MVAGKNSRPRLAHWVAGRSTNKQQIRFGTVANANHRYVGLLDPKPYGSLARSLLKCAPPEDLCSRAGHGG